MRPGLSFWCSAGLRNFMAQLQEELLRIDPKAFARALSKHSGMGMG